MGKFINLIKNEAGPKGDKGDTGARGADGAGALPPSDTIINKVDGKITSIVNLYGTTTLNRDINGVLVSITKPDHTKLLLRDSSGIIGYDVI